MFVARFFIDPKDFQSDFMVLTGENAAHAKVLRIKQGEKVTVCDGQGREAVCTVSDVSPGLVSLVVEEQSPSTTEARIRASIYMAFPKGDKLEHVIQKATELGAYEIVAFPTARCVSRPDDKSIKKKLERWQKIAESAAEQSGRGRVPNIIVLGRFGEAIGRAKAADKAILFYENERAYTLRAALEESPYQSISLMTGPEGGWDEKEVADALGACMKICTLGSRILRCETAPLCALSAVMYDSGEF